MFHTTKNGHKIWYELNGNGPGIILLHGLGGSLDSMKRIAYDLDDDYTRILVDLPCHGKSDNFSLSLRELSYEMVAIMRENSFRKFSGVGVSLGAIILEETLFDFGDALKNAALMSPTSGFDNEVANMIMKWATVPGQTAKDVFSPEFFEMHEREIEEYENENPFLPERLAPLLSEIIEFTTIDRVSNNFVLLLMGKYDRLFGKRMLDDLRDSFPNSEYSILDSGHAIHREKPDLASKLILEFFKKHSNDGD
ncbi:MAG: alpha/beta hydrolase [Thermoplasmatales archaeon]|nr:alpha/beta hydrolase [Thermoplasmatales archaeon]MCW6169627.1 alpha/beta hydrolase [Thermoplasmatales archaeon]